MKLQQLLGCVRRAADDYTMIADGDRIAVGISGGKDSLTLLYALHELKRFYPHPFTLQAITVDLGLGNFNLERIQEFCAQLDVPYSIVSTNIGTVLFDVRKETNPCSLCAKLRKGAFDKEALKLGCNVVAYAHHKDDVVETMLLSLLHEGRFYCFSPVTHLERSGLTVIRPLMYVDENDVIGIAKQLNLPVCKNPCPVDGRTQRAYVKELVKQLNAENPGARDSMFTAIINGSIPGWPERSESAAEFRRHKHRHEEKTVSSEQDSCAGNEPQADPHVPKAREENDGEQTSLL